MSVSSRTSMLEVLPHFDGDYNRPSTPSKPFGDFVSFHDSLEDRGDRAKDKSVSRYSDSERGQRSKSSQTKISKKSIQIYPPNSRIQIDKFISTRELKSQVLDLQRQLTEAQNENKLLKRVQNRYKVALQHFQDSEGSISETLTKHKNEVRGLRALLRDTRRCRNHLSRQLQATEYELLNTKTRLDHLQQLSQDQSLKEKDELIRMLDEANAELESKDKRVIYLEKNLQLCQDSFNRQLASVHKKLCKARNISCDLQDQIHHLKKDNEEKAKKLQAHNIYSNRFLKGSTKLDKENKVVQTQGLVLLPASYLHASQSATEKSILEKVERSEDQQSSHWYEDTARKRFLKFQETKDPPSVTSESRISQYNRYPKNRSVYFTNEKWEPAYDRNVSSEALQGSGSSDSEDMEGLRDPDSDTLQSPASSETEDQVVLRPQGLEYKVKPRSKVLNVPQMSKSADCWVLESKVLESPSIYKSTTIKDPIMLGSKIKESPTKSLSVTFKEPVGLRSKVTESPMMSGTATLDTVTIKSETKETPVTAESAALEDPAKPTVLKTPAKSDVLKTQAKYESLVLGEQVKPDAKVSEAPTTSQELQKTGERGSGKSSSASASKRKGARHPVPKKKQSPLQTPQNLPRESCSRLCRRTNS